VLLLVIGIVLPASLIIDLQAASFFGPPHSRQMLIAALIFTPVSPSALGALTAIKFKRLLVAEDAAHDELGGSAGSGPYGGLRGRALGNLLDSV
jgi:hypothetical protein